MASVSVLALLGAFVAGLLSFLSPCVLPLTPVYLAQLVGPAVWQDRHDRQDQRDHGEQAHSDEKAVGERAWVRRATVLYAAAFVGGFSLAFIALGATASAMGAFLSAHAELLRRIGGIILFALGLHVAGLVRLPGVDRELRLWPRLALGASQQSGADQIGYPLTFLVGVIFGLGWTPCVGPLLAGILLLAAQAGTLAAGVLLLAVYSLGLGVPFLALALAFDRLAPLLKRLTPQLRSIEIGTGILLMVMGIVIFCNWLIYANAWVRLPVLPLP
jgi:cytochrome c-type biogenesis protein